MKILFQTATAEARMLPSIMPAGLLMLAGPIRG
jgi:hypothetical protein